MKQLYISTNFKKKMKQFHKETNNGTAIILYNMFCDFESEYKKGRIDKISALSIFGFYTKMYKILKSQYYF